MIRRAKSFIINKWINYNANQSTVYTTSIRPNPLNWNFLHSQMQIDFILPTNCGIRDGIFTKYFDSLWHKDINVWHNEFIAISTQNVLIYFVKFSSHISQFVGKMKSMGKKFTNAKIAVKKI